jgi:hypothetical protein
MRPVACPPISLSIQIKMVGTAQERLCPPYECGRLSFDPAMPHSAIAAIASEISTL